MKTLLLILIPIASFAQTYILDGIEIKHPKVKDYILWCYKVQDTLHHMTSEADTLRKFHYDIKPIQKVKKKEEDGRIVFSGSTGTIFGYNQYVKKPYELRNERMYETYTHRLNDTWGQDWYLCPRVPTKSGFYKWLKWNK